MPDVSPIQLIIVMIIALVVLGPKRLPEMGKSLGKGIREFKPSVSGDEHPPLPAPIQPDDQLAVVDHLDELRGRLVVVLAVLTVAVGICFWQSAAILNAMAAPLPQHGGHAYQFLATSPLDGILTSISVAVYGGLLLTMPIATYQVYAFLIPAV